MAIVSSALINALRTGYSREFETAKAKAPTQWASIATRVPSGNTSNTYGWLGQFPKLREWTGDRVFNSIKEYGYTVTNKLYEATVDIPRTAVEDDELGTYTPLFQEMGYAAATHPDEIIFGLLKNGNTELCYDGKPFFTNDHPVYPNVDGTGTVQTISNLLASSSSPGTSWYLLDVSRPLRPFIFQERTTPELQVVTNPDNDTVFMKDKIPYGIRYRCNGGYGFWQQAVQSTHPLDTDSFELALLTLQGFTADGGRPLGLGFGGKPGTLLVVPPTLQADARKVLVAEKNDMGASNIWYDAASIVVSPWLL